jgi:hypothetical protein
MSNGYRDNSGTLGKNNRKEKDSHPSHAGQCTVDGKRYWISAWVKDGRDGSKFFSLAFKPMEQRGGDHPQSPANKPSPAPADREFDDDVPF